MVFVADGLTWYLPEDAVALLLDHVAGIAAPGSWLCVDMVGADYLANRGAAAPFFALAAARGARWQFGTNDLGSLLAATAGRPTSTTCTRWPPASAGGHQQGSPRAVADRAGAAAASLDWFISATRVP